MLGWQARPSPNPRPVQDNVLTGRGVAYARYKHSENYVAMAMDVTVDPASGKIGVRRVTCAHDCGLVVNPDGLRNQIEGSIVQTLSRTLHEEVQFDRASVTSVDWVSYPILTFPEVPAIEVALLDRPALPPFGAGEASTAPWPPPWRTRSSTRPGSGCAPYPSRPTGSKRRSRRAEEVEPRRECT